MSSLMMNVAAESSYEVRRRAARETVPTPAEARALLPELAVAVPAGGTVRDALRHAFDATFPVGASGVLTRSQMFDLRWDDAAFGRWLADPRVINCTFRTVSAHVLDVAVRECRDIAGAAVNRDITGP